MNVHCVIFNITLFISPTKANWSGPFNYLYRCKTDADIVISLARQINEQMVSKVASLDEDLICTLSYTCRGCFAPLCAAIGGFIAQEGLKALTGKFTPLNQMVL